MSPRRPGRRLARSPGSAKPRPKVLIVCEGATELNYFTGLRDSADHDIHPVKAEESKYPQRERVVGHAREARHKAAYSQVWAVFDADCQDVRRVCDAARSDGIEVAVSNPAFEVWLILHLKDHRGPMQPTEPEAVLKGLEKRWSKGRGTRFEHFADGLESACARAENLPEHGNPSTGVWRLMHAILKDKPGGGFPGG